MKVKNIFLPAFTIYLILISITCIEVLGKDFTQKQKFVILPSGIVFSLGCFLGIVWGITKKSADKHSQLNRFQEGQFSINLWLRGLVYFNLIVLPIWLVYSKNDCGVMQEHWHRLTVLMPFLCYYRSRAMFTYISKLKSSFYSPELNRVVF